MIKAQAEIDAREAAVGERTIEIKIHFWTNDLAGKKGMVRAKHAWSCGVVRVERNKAHGITPKNPRPFQSLMHLPAVIEKVLIEHGLTFHQSRQMRKYFTVE
jgi:hypothetical protein